jgi:UDP-N-acetylglucosamine--N-acetylmuramyl-(pentapeptide) pyrophosphoryl-undecaprenol N-acetylglucosamine transferase
MQWPKSSTGGGIFLFAMQAKSNDNAGQAGSFAEQGQSVYAKKKVKVIISGGGTGGHIFPAISIANALKAKVDGIEILFVGANGRMEMEKVPAAGYKIVGLNISGIQRRITTANLSLPFKLIGSVRQSSKIIKEFNPDVVVGVGGYASGPLLLAATLKKLPVLIQEQNSYAGVTNKFLSKWADKICVAYPNMERFFPKEKIILTGNPVRQDINNLEGKRQRGIELFGLDPNKKTILIIGGSLGARTINQAIENTLSKFARNNIQIVWQTGKTYFEKAKLAVKPYEGQGIRALDFIQKMDYAYSVADMVISRAGASSVSELCIVHKPCILVPSPNVAEDHQTQNAMALVNHNAAVLVKDTEAIQKLGDIAIELLNNEKKLLDLERNIAHLAMHNSAEIIANEVLNLIKSDRV